jgi:DNA-binding transcriptional ArsR family regulator
MNQSIFDLQASFCKTMGNAVRLRILHVLREGPMTVGEICQAMELPQTTISHQLSVLRSLGVVAPRQLGNSRVYQITDEKIGVVCDLVRSVLVEQIRARSHSIE